MEIVTLVELSIPERQWSKKGKSLCSLQEYSALEQIIYLIPLKCVAVYYFVNVDTILLKISCLIIITILNYQFYTLHIIKL